MENQNIETVVGKMAKKCMDARLAGLPLIMIDTFDIELVGDIALQSGIVTPLKDWQYTGEPRDRHYFEFLSRDSENIRDYKNYYDKWPYLMRKDSKAFDIRQMAAGMYILPLAADAWNQRNGEGDHRIARLREYVREYLFSIDPSSPVMASCIILYGDTKFLPDDLMPYTSIVEEEYPKKKEIRDILTRMTDDKKLPLDEEVVQELMKSLAGFRRGDVIRRINALLRAGDINGQAAILDPDFRRKSILTAKEQVLLKNGGILELIEDDETEPDLSGMGAYRKWVEDRKEQMADSDRYLLERGTLPLKGVLMCGVPGCGKSQAAKMLPKVWEGIPLIKMNIDALMGGIVGESEKNLRTALQQAEAMAPCIVWIEELEKGFSGAASKQSGDSGTFKRMFGRLLNWMQDNKRPCFIFATANDISQLPDEFFRKGRFDQLFSVYMPTHDECRDIFRAQMKAAEKARKKQAEDMGVDIGYSLFEESCYDDAELDAIMKQFTENLERLPEVINYISGADIADIVKQALWKVDVSRPVTPGHWRKVVSEVIQSDIKTMGSGYASLDSIAACYLRLLRGKFVPASAEDQVLFQGGYLSVEWDEDSKRICKACYYGEYPEVDGQDNDYDRAFHQVMKEHMNRLATDLENNARAKLVN